MLAAIVAALAVAWLALPVPQAAAQSPQGKIQIQVVNGTKDAPSPTVGNFPVTLYIADMNASNVVTQTGTTDATGSATFSNLSVISTTRYLALARYNEIDYVSEVFSFEPGQTLFPISVTVYESTTDPSVIRVAQAHLIMDVQTRVINVTEIVQITNTSDRTFIGATPVGNSPHRVTLLLPTLVGATEIQFDDPEVDATTVRGLNILSYTFPIQPGNDQVIFNYRTVYNPPTYDLSIRVPYDVSKLRLLISDVGQKFDSSQLSAITPFPTQMGVTFLQTSADNLTKGTEVKATMSNLPETVAGSAFPGTVPAPSTSGAPTTAPADNSQVIGFAVLGAAAVAAIALIAYPLVRRRAQARPALEPETGSASSSRREHLLQAIADLDDDFEAGKVSESTFKEERERLKSKLIDLGDTEE